MARYAFDPELAAAVGQLHTVMDLGDPAVIRAMRSTEGRFVVAGADRSDVHRRELLIDGYGGGTPVPVRVYEPIAPPTGLRPGVLEIHGGGFIMGDIPMMDAWCQAVASGLDAVVLSVDYRLAPEHPYPAALHDCYAALLWLAAEAATLGIDAARIAIAGQSAGGALAAGVSLFSRDHAGPRPCFQLLEIPVMDDRLDTPSMRAFTDTPLWNRPNAEWGWRHYLGPLFGGDVPAYAAPLRAKDLSGLPPAYLSTMEFDPLRDEGLLYGMRLLQAGVAVELHNFPGTFHGSTLVPEAQVSQRITRESFAALARGLAPR